MTTATEMSPQSPTERTPVARWRLWLWRSVKAMLMFVGSYIAIVVIGLLPVNNNFQPTPDGIPIYISSSAVHADIWLPVNTDQMHWFELFSADHFVGNVTQASYVIIGWGDKGFYLETPTWAELKASTALSALLMPSDCCLHVEMSGMPNAGLLIHKVMISSEQYQRMVKCITDSLKFARQQPVLIEGEHYGQYDVFYEAKGNYHCLNTCNSWVGWVMREAGIKVPMLTPMPNSMLIYLPD